MEPFRLLLACGITVAILCGGCQKAYYNTMEKFGHHKRDILVDRVEESKEAQQEAKEQFKTALESFTEVVSFEGGELQSKYDKLKSELDRSESKAGRVSKRIRKVEEVAEALFEEWQEELKQYSNEQYRRKSEEQLARTKDSYNRLITAMRRAEGKMEPVLSAFRDQVLFLKHNLNARAVASLQDELVNIETDIASLVAEMEVSIAEAEAFISDMTD
jgi:Skp family chaperone for outer membrane proteins